MATAPAWLVWAIIALLSGLAELHAPGSYLIWIAIAAVLTAIVTAIWQMPMEAQIIFFAIAALASCGVGFYVYRRVNRPARGDAALNQRNVAMLGARGVVSVQLRNGHGKVRLGDSDWLAEGPEMEAGAAVVVSGVRGTVVIVAPLPAKQAAPTGRSVT